jgi:hypothetical protein
MVAVCTGHTDFNLCHARRMGGIRGYYDAGHVWIRLWDFVSHPCPDCISERDSVESEHSFTAR